MRISTALLLSAPAFLVARALADPIPVLPIATSGQAAPGTGGAVFVSFSHNPVMGDLPGFWGTARGTDGTDFTGIWTPGGDLMLRAVALEGGTAPGTSGGLFASLASRDPQIRGGTLFSAQLQPGTGDVTDLNKLAIFRVQPSTSSIIVRMTGPATPSGGIFSIFGNPPLQDFTVSSFGLPHLQGTMANGPGGVTESNNTGVWGGNPVFGQFTLIAREFDSITIPGRGPARFSAFQAPLVSGSSPVTFFRGTVTFTAGGSADGLFMLNSTSAAGGAATIAVISGNQVGSQPLPTGTISSIQSYGVGGSSPGSQTGWATVIVSTTGVTHLFSHLGRLLSSDTAVAGVRFSGFGAPVMSYETAIAANAVLSQHPSGVSAATDDCLIYFPPSMVPTQPLVIAREGSQSPGCPAGTLFDSFSSPTVNDASSVVFAANLRPGTGDVTASNARGIWCASRSIGSPGAEPTVGLVLRLGQTVQLAPGDIRTVADFNFIQGVGGDDGRRTSFSASNLLSVWLRFTDGTETIALLPAAQQRGTSMPTRLGPVVLLNSGDAFRGAAQTIAAQPPSMSARVMTTKRPPGIYRHRLTITADTPAPVDGAIAGLPQVDGVVQPLTPQVVANWPVVQQAGQGTPPRYNQWYGFGRGEVIPWIGSSTLNNQVLTATLGTIEITPTDVGIVRAGPITITTAGQGHEQNTELFLYDADLQPVPGALNDDGPIPPLSTLALTLAPGTYYLAVGDANTASDQPSPPGDGDRNSPVLEYPGALVNGSSASNIPLSFLITDSAGSHPVAATKSEPFEVLWYRLTVRADRCNAADVAGLGGVPGSDGQNTPDDLILFLTAFFGGDLAVADIAGLGGSPAPDGQLTADDLIRFLDHFFASCQ